MRELFGIKDWFITFRETLINFMIISNQGPALLPENLTLEDHTVHT